MNILGINAFHGDSAAALLHEGHFISGIEEERLLRVKHWAGFPNQAISSVLQDEGPGAVSHIAISRDPSAHLLKKVLFGLQKRPGLAAVGARLQNHRKLQGISERLHRTGLPALASELKIHNVEHHRAHLASAFFCSPFERAACLTVDGFGDFLSSMSAVGEGNRIRPLDQVLFPHSLGVFYTAVTQYLGFPKYGDEYKVMGLAAYGCPRFLPQMKEIVRLKDEGQFELELDYFVHGSEGVTMSWEGGEPAIGPLWSARFVDKFGAAREPGGEIAELHMDIAASVQAMYEEAFFHRLRWLQQRTGQTALCLAGGCAMNSVANGKILRNTDFKDVFIQSAAGDAGTALGAALYVWHQVMGKPRSFVMTHSYWGPEFDDAAIAKDLNALTPGLSGGIRVGAGRTNIGNENNCQINICRYDSQDDLCRVTARQIADGRIVGWFQGRGEWGPRALGNRSILADPRRAEMKAILNSRIKMREPFRPFAPSILLERVDDYFEDSYPDPFMIKVYPIRPVKRADIPAVTHEDGTGRLQTVAKDQNPLYWQLIKCFDSITHIPVILNTSFNENEPMVNTPCEAIACFLRTLMDTLVLGQWVVERKTGN
jgi:carbamoyltransferase